MITRLLTIVGFLVLAVDLFVIYSVLILSTLYQFGIVTNG